MSEKVYVGVKPIQVEIDQASDLTNVVCKDLEVGDVVFLRNESERKTFVVSSKDNENGTMKLTYVNNSGVQEIAYKKGASGWVYDKTTTTTFSTLEVGDIITVPAVLNVGEGTFTHETTLTKAQYDKIADNGLVIIMFNTTCVVIPYIKAQENRFVCNASYDELGNSMVARAYLKVNSTRKLVITYNAEYVAKMVENEMSPYAIVRFIKF